MLDKSPRPAAVNVPNDLAAHWMPFTANRAFKKAPRLLAGAKDMHYFTVGRKIIDAAAGMWCCNAAMAAARFRRRSPSRPSAGLCAAVPVRHSAGLRARKPHRRSRARRPDHVFFCNSGSEAADVTALKMRAGLSSGPGPGHRTCLSIGRERRLSRRRLRRHFGRRHRRIKSTQDVRDPAGFMPTICCTPMTARNRPSPGRAEYGAHFADELERLVNLRRLHRRRRDRRTDGGIDRRCCRRQGAASSGCANRKRGDLCGFR